MSNGHVCCILAVCCPPGIRASREKRIAALASFMANEGKEMHPGDKGYVAAGPMHSLCAAAVIDNFDLAEKGTLELLVKSISLTTRRAMEKNALPPIGAAIDSQDDGA